MFSLDGADYEIDLSKKNAASLRKAFAEYIAAGRSIRSQRQAVRTKNVVAPRRTKDRSAELAAIREWAAKAGFQVSQKGRISQEVLDRYSQEHSD